MRKAFYHLLILMFLVSCSDNDDNVSIKIGDRFTHEIPGCDNSENAEINCMEFLEIVNADKLDILYGGGDIVVRIQYTVKGNLLSLEQDPISSFALPFDFKILDEKTLQRTDNGDIWIKEN